MEKHKALREETDASIAQVLTDDQKQQFEAWKSQRKEHFKNRRDKHEPK
jgi:Spy/CpxP family protein refolding chaperone